ncbi:hypothetical protein F2Q69_00013207 [Brassica cretica]|uniref:DUF1985 domain-containing protein n=1 Tax=Brassica cretica TaxID=69181 RepID=A0A8S9R987_BRACR|nr:hypothetical protein F2Q69_00013207 [Brassica cretica]
MVMDLETFEQNPWGYEAFTDLVFSIKGITSERLSKESYSINGFVQVLQIWVYAETGNEDPKRTKLIFKRTFRMAGRRILKLSAQEEEKVVTTRNVVTQMYHELAKKTIEKVDKFEGQVNGLSHDVEELKHDNSMRGDNHLAAT